MRNHCKKFVVAVLLFVATGLTAFAQAPLSDNMPASGVLGQGTMVGRLPGNIGGEMNNAFGVAIDPTTGSLFVADRNNNRVLRFSSDRKLGAGSTPECGAGPAGRHDEHQRAVGRQDEHAGPGVRGRRRHGCG